MFLLFIEIEATNQNLTGKTLNSEGMKTGTEPKTAIFKETETFL